MAVAAPGSVEASAVANRLPPGAAGPSATAKTDGAAERAPIDYLILGHVTVDRLDDERVVMGGTVTYAGLTVRNMGGRVGIHTSASYEPGLIDLLRGTLVARIPAEYTTCFVNQYHGGARRQKIESVAEKLSYDQILPEWRNPSVVHLGPLCQELEPSIVGRFPKSLVGVTPQGWMRAWGDSDGAVHAVEWADADRVLSQADVVIISENDVPHASVIDDWASKARLLVVTLGERGCVVYKKGVAEPYRSPAFKPTTEDDPTGAGDVFAAAYFWHLRQSQGNWRQSADWANCVASFAVEKRGVGGVPKLGDVEKRWQSGKRIGGSR